MEMLPEGIVLDAFKMKINRFNTKEVLFDDLSLWKL